MSYERLTSRNDFQGQCSHHKFIPALAEFGCWNDTEKRFMLCNKCENKERYDRLKELEDKIENGLLVERYFIKDDITPYGKVFHNVCEYDPSTYIIIQQCDTISEAEEKLRELRGEK